MGTLSGFGSETERAARSTCIPYFEGPVFAPLQDPLVFEQFQIHPEFHTLVWANGADIAPEFLHDNVRVTAFKWSRRP